MSKAAPHTKCAFCCFFWAVSHSATNMPNSVLKGKVAQTQRDLQITQYTRTCLLHTVGVDVYRFEYGTKTIHWTVPPPHPLQKTNKQKNRKKKSMQSTNIRGYSFSLFLSFVVIMKHFSGPITLLFMKNGKKKNWCDFSVRRQFFVLDITPIYLFVLEHFTGWVIKIWVITIFVIGQTSIILNIRIIRTCTLLLILCSH